MGMKTGIRSLGYYVNRRKLANKQGVLSAMILLLPNMIEARAHGYMPMVDLKKTEYNRVCCRNHVWQKGECLRILFYTAG